MTFVVTVKSDTTGADPAVDRLVVKLERAEAAGTSAGAAISRGARSGSASLVLTERSANQAGQALARAGREGSASMQAATRSTAGLTSEVNRLAAALGLVFTVRATTGMLDTYTEISNRLNTVAKDQANLNGLLEASHGIAQDTFTDWNVTANAVVRFTNATKELGISQRDVLDFTTSLNKAIILSGASASESTNGLIQLSQGLASGALRGDELRSVLENLPTVAAVIAKGMGKTLGELRKMGAEGKITAEAVYGAFQKAGPEIEAKFGKVIPTITQNLTLLKNEATRFFGVAAQGAGVMRTIGDAFRFVIDNFDTFGKVALGVAEALIGLYVIEKIIVLVRLLTVAIAANPLGALLVLLVATIAVLRQFGDSVVSATNKMTTLGDYLSVLWQDFKQLGSVVLDFVSGAWSALTSAVGGEIDTSDFELSIGGVLRFVARVVDGIIARVVALKKTMVVIFGGLPVIIGEVFVDIARGAARVFQEMINTVIRGINALTGSINVEKVRKQFMEGQAKGLTGDALKEYSTRGATSGISEVDLSFKNPLAGASDHAREQLKAAWGEDFGSSVAEDFMDGWMDSITQRADEAARKRVFDRMSLGWSPDDGISDERGKKGAVPVRKEVETAMDKLKRELASITAASSPMIDAQMKLAKAVDVTDRAMAAHLITLAEADRIVSDTAAKTAEAREPYLAWTSAIDQEIAALKLSNGERERANDILEESNKLRAAGLVVTPELAGGIAAHVDELRGAKAAADAYNAKQRELQSTLEAIKGPEWEHARGLENTRTLLRDGAITGAEYAAAIKKIEEAYKGTKIAGTDFDAGLSRGLASIKTEILDVASVVETTLKNAFHGVEDAIVELVTTGEISFKRMVNSMLSDLTRLLIRQALAGLIGSFGGGGISSVFGSSASQGFEGMFGSAPGYARGTPPGGLTVSGRPGIDTNLVAMRVSNGENITVTPQGQQAQGREQPVQLHVHNHYDDSAISDYMEREGERHIANYMARHQPAIRGRSTGR